MHVFCVSAGHNGKTKSSVFLPEPAPIEDLFPEGISQSYLAKVPKLIRDELKLSSRAPDQLDGLKHTVDSSKLLFTSEQRRAYDDITAAIDAGNGGVFFLDAPGGTGKTFVCKAILAYARLGQNREGGRHAEYTLLLLQTSQSHPHFFLYCCRVALACASSGIAATLIPGARTAHSRHSIPAKGLTAESMCPGLKANHDCVLRQLEEMSVLNTWDEITMTHRWAVEALNRSLQDVLCDEDTVFAGKIFVFSGDFRQVIPSHT